MPEAFEERQQEAADAGVGVKVDSAFGRERREFGNRIDDAVGIVRSRADDERGVVSDHFGGGADIGAQIGAQWNLLELQAQVFGCLGEGRMRRYWGEQLRLGDALFFAG